MTGWSLAYFLRLILRAFFFFFSPSQHFCTHLHSVWVWSWPMQCVWEMHFLVLLLVWNLCTTQGDFFLFYKVFLDSHKMKRWVYVMICVTAFKHRPSRNICFWPSVPPPPKKSIKFMTTIQARLPNCLIGVVLNYCSSLFLCSVVSS